MKTEIDTEEKVLDTVTKFRLDWLIGVYSAENALTLAENKDIDWHFAYKLRQECPDEELCLKILL